jgi:hypothetical protein
MEKGCESGTSPAAYPTWVIWCCAGYLGHLSEKGTLRAIYWSHSACRSVAAQVESVGMHVIYT